MDFNIWTVFLAVWTMFGLPALGWLLRKFGRSLDRNNDSEVVVFFRNLAIDAVQAIEQNVGRGVLQKGQEKTTATATVMAAMTPARRKSLEKATGRPASEVVSDAIEAAVAATK